MKKYKIITIDGEIYEVDRAKVDFLEFCIAFFYSRPGGQEGRIMIPYQQLKIIEEILVQDQP